MLRIKLIYELAWILFRSDYEGRAQRLGSPNSDEGTKLYLEMYLVGFFNHITKYFGMFDVSVSKAIWFIKLLFTIFNSRYFKLITTLLII